jgi:Anti-sigma factor NepR
VQQEKSSALTQAIGRSLHAHYQAIVSEPLPKRWVDLIKHLNEKEEQETAERKQGCSRDQ